MTLSLVHRVAKFSAVGSLLGWVANNQWLQNEAGQQSSDTQIGAKPSDCDRAAISPKIAPGSQNASSWDSRMCEVKSAGDVAPAGAGHGLEQQQSMATPCLACLSFDEGMLIGCDSVTRNAPRRGVVHRGRRWPCLRLVCKIMLPTPGSNAERLPPSRSSLTQYTHGPTRHLASDDYPGCEALMRISGSFSPSISIRSSSLAAFLPQRPRPTGEPCSSFLRRHTCLE
jgi:hypothetical protein